MGTQDSIRSRWHFSATTLLHVRFYEHVDSSSARDSFYGLRSGHTLILTVCVRSHFYSSTTAQSVAMSSLSSLRCHFRLVIPTAFSFFSNSSSLAFKVRRWAIREAYHRFFFHGEGRAGHWILTSQICSGYFSGEISMNVELNRIV